MSANSARNLPECIVMKVGNWIILAVLLGMLSATIWIAYDIWKDDRRRSNFRERLHRIGCWCGAITISWLRADGAAVLQKPSRVR
jgi:hypothetical protein